MNAAIQVILDKVSESRFGLSKPAFIEGYTVATDGHRLLAVTGNYTEGVEPHDRFPAASIRQWLKETPDITAIVKAGDLLAFVGPMPSDTCDRCNGKFRKYATCPQCDQGHDCLCEYCNEGKTLKERRMLIGPAVTNANLISDVFAALAPTGVVSISVPSADDKLYIRGEGFIFIMMPMRKDSVAPKDLREMPQLISEVSK